MWSMAMRSIKRPRSRSGGKARELGFVGLEGSGSGMISWRIGGSESGSGGSVP
jgi:hypothetical protein